MAFSSQEIHPIKPNFTSGEVSPLIKGRVDVSRYLSGVARMENMLPLVQGGAFRRSGTVFGAETKDSGKVRMVPFIFSEEQSYTLEFGDLYIRFYTQNAQVTEAGTAITNTSQTNPVVVDATAHGLSNGDRVVITGVIGMTELNNREFTVANQTANDFELSGIDGTGFTAYTSGGTVAEIFEIVSPWSGTEIQELQFAQSADVMYITHPDFDVRKLSRTSALVWPLTPVTFTGITFTGVDERPGSVAFYEQRLVLARTNEKPLTVFLSKAGDLENFTTGTNPEDAIEYAMVAKQVNEIRWLSLTGKVLGIGTEGAEFEGGSTDFNEGVTPLNFRIRQHTSFGSKSQVPVAFDTSTLYLQRAKRKLREFTYDFQKDGFISTDLTVLSDQILFEEGIDLAYQQEPNNNIYVTTTSEHMACLTYQKEQQVVGWAKIFLGGTDVLIESVGVIPGTTEDQVWVAVKRTINSSTFRSTEFFKPRFIETVTIRKEDAFFVDSGLTFESPPKTISGATKTDPVVITATAHGFSDGDFIKIRSVKGMTELNDRRFKVASKTANTFELNDRDDNTIDGTGFTEYISGGNARLEVTTIENLNHLIGETVEILVDGRSHDKLIVDSGGRITLSFGGSIIQIGLGNTALIETLPFEPGNPLGTTQGKTTTISRIKIRFYQALGGTIRIQDGDKSQLVFNKLFDTMDQSPPLLTGLVPDTYPFNAIPEEPSLIYENSQPFPVTILAILPEYKVSP